MTDALKVAVSQRTLDELGSTPEPWLQLRRADMALDSAVLWRRQADSTDWAITVAMSMPRLRWLHTDTAGVDRLPLAQLHARRILLTHARGAHTPAVSEWALAGILTAAKGMHDTVRRSDQREWTSVSKSLQLAGSTVVILSVGSIGSALARACSALDMRVVGVSRTKRNVPQLSRQLTVNEAWFDELPRTSFLANCLPLTALTAGFVDARVFAALPRHAWLVNVGRGETVDENALVAAIDDSALGGAILDTVRAEPPGRDSPLWGHPNIILGSHASSHTDATQARTLELFVEEAAQYRRGEPLTNVVDFSRGY